MKNIAIGRSNFLKRTLQLIGWLFTLLIIQITFQSSAANAGSLDFTGGTGNVTVPYASRIDVDSGAFTIEMFVKETERIAGSNVTGSVWISSAGGWWGSGDAGTGALSLANSDCGFSLVNGSRAVTTLGHYGQDCAFSSETSRSDYLNDHGWHHIAISKTATNGSMQMYIDGTRVVYSANDNSYWGLEHKGVFGNLAIGGSFKGYISNVRLVKGQGLYTGTSITVPTSKLTTTSQGAIAANVSLLLTSDSAANVAVDTSPTPSVLSNNNALYSSTDPFLITPTFTWSDVTKTLGDTPFKVTDPIPSTPGTFTYSSSTPAVIALDNTYTDSATVVSNGSSVITATFTPTNSAAYRSGSTSMTITVNKRSQSALILSLSSTSFNGLGSKAITFSTTGGTDTGTVSYSVKAGGTASGCALSNANTNTSDTITATSTGTCLLQAVKAATNNYATETSTAVTFNFLSAQTFAYDSGTATSGTTPTGGTYYAGDTITVSSGSGLSKPGFKLNGWKNNSNVSYAAGSTFTVSTADTLTAQWRQASLFGIADADLTEVQNWNVINGFSAGGNIGNGTDTFTVTVPANALTAGTAVKLYALSSSALAQSKIGAGNTYILNMVVAWLYGQTVPTATSAVTLRIESPSIKKDAVAYMIIGDTVTAVGTATQDGVINTYFTEDPVITVVNPVVQNNNGGGGGGGGNSNTVVIVEKPIEIVEPVVISKPTSPRLITMSTKVYFGLNASWINSLNIKSVKEFISRISLQASIKEVTIQGFTQPTVINPNPLGLSKARANSVAKLVKGLGVTSKVVAVGKGNEKRNLPTSRYVLVTVTGEAKS